MAQDGVDVACFGETMLLLVPDPPAEPADAECFRREIGGAESNVAINLRRLGAHTSWHSVVGDDAFGDYVVSRIESEGVRCDVRRDPGRPTGLYVKELRDGSTTVRYYRNGSAASQLTVADARRLLQTDPRIIHTTGITPALSTVNRETVDWLWESADGPALSFDVNYRPALHGPDFADPLRALANRADIVFCGEDEAAALWGCATADDVREVISAASVLVVKQGAQGAVVYSADGARHEPAPDVEVVEPVGAGDAFAAGFLYRWLEGKPPGEALALGSVLAGRALGVHGDLPAIDDAATAGE